MPRTLPTRLPRFLRVWAALVNVRDVASSRTRARAERASSLTVASASNTAGFPAASRRKASRSS